MATITNNTSTPYLSFSYFNAFKRYRNAVKLINPCELTQYVK